MYMFNKYKIKAAEEEWRPGSTWCGDGSRDGRAEKLRGEEGEEIGVCGRGESGECECVWRSHAGALGPARGVWPTGRDSAHVGLLGSGLDGGESGELGSADNFFLRSRLKQSLGAWGASKILIKFIKVYRLNFNLI